MAQVVADGDGAELTRFSGDLPDHLSSSTRDALLRRVAELEPWLQGPFYLGGDVVVWGAWRVDWRWASLLPQLPSTLAGTRVLDVGCNAGYDPFMFKKLGASHVLACEPVRFIEQARFLESIYRTGVDFRSIGWQQLDPDEHGTFDLVHCNGVLYHEPSPVALLQGLRRMLRPDGHLYLGSMTLSDPELSQYVRFVPDSFLGDDSWWMVPGALSLRWMLDVTGFRILDEFGNYELDEGEFPVTSLYIHAVAKDPAPTLPTVRP